MERKNLIDKRIMKKLREKLHLRTIYHRINRIQEECLTSREDGAYLLAIELGIPVYNHLSEAKLSELRELHRTRNNSNLVRVESNNIKTKTKRTKIEKESITPNMNVGWLF